MNNCNEYLGDVNQLNYIHPMIVGSSLPLNNSFLGLAALALIALSDLNEHLLCSKHLASVSTYVISFMRVTSVSFL